MIVIIIIIIIIYNKNLYCKSSIFVVTSTAFTVKYALPFIFPISFLLNMEED